MKLKFMEQLPRYLENARTGLNDFMRFTPRRLLIIGAFLGLYNAASNPITAHHYASDDMPPAFRNMDVASGWESMKLYMEARRIGPDTLLVLGDCVGYGNGSAESFSHYMSIPARRVLNLSMHSYNYDLMMMTIDYAVQKGVKDIVIQLHPFHNYCKDSLEWEKELETLYGPGTKTVNDLDADEIVKISTDRWRPTGVAMDSAQKKFSFHDSIEHTTLLEYSAWLRYDLVSHFPLFRNRYVMDDALGLDVSFYSFMTQRRDTFLEPLPEDRQQEIFERPSMDFLWKLFVVSDRENYRRLMEDYSPQIRIARYAREKRINVVFLMVPTIVDKIAHYTVAQRKDFMFSDRVFRDIARREGAGYLGYLDNRRLLPYMYHYDNLTVEGQKLLGEIINNDLPDILGHLRKDKERS